MATTPDFQGPQIAAARAKAWHQAGEPLLTLEAARTWLNQYGLVLFAPRGGALGVPAPSLVEATLGTAKPNTTPADAATARTLVARLVGEGSALPLNLLGTPGDLPDFIVSAQAFPFVFTLRGDKGWKRPPETSGAVKVTPLALGIYELLSERGALTVADIVPEIGREVTESAVSRSLLELWSLLRVIPVLQQGEGETLWELTSTRFLKAVKAGANGGQPTALSALVSLYLGQAYLGTEEDISTFLSPLTARSRVRDVLHGLVASRQVSEAVLTGKSVLYIPDTLPDFAAFEAPAAEGIAPEGAIADEHASTEDTGAGERIRRFGQDGGRAQDRNLRGKPVRREGSAPARPPARGPAREREQGGDRPARRPFGKGPDGPDRSDRSDRSDRPNRPMRPRPAVGGDRRPSSDRPSFGRPDRREGAGGGAPRSFSDRSGAKRPERREGGSFGAPRAPRTDRPSFSRPWDEERSARPRRPREGDDAQGGSRPPRPFGDRPARPAGETRSDRGARPPRPLAERDGARPPRRDFPGGERPSFRPRPAAGQGDAGGDRRSAGPRGDRPQRPFRDRNAEGNDRPFRPRQGPPREGGFGDRRGPGGRPQGAREGGSRTDDRGPRGEGSGRPGGRPSFGGGTGRPSFGGGTGRPARGGFAGGPRGEGRGGFRPGPGGRPGAKSPGRPRPSRPDRPGASDRPARTPRPEDEA